MTESNNYLSLKDLRIDEPAEITGYQKGRKELISKFIAMGLIKGTPIKVLRFAPLGDPVDIEVLGTSLSLRKDEASRIYVRRNQ